MFYYLLYRPLATILLYRASRSPLEIPEIPLIWRCVRLRGLLSFWLVIGGRERTGDGATLPPTDRGSGKINMRPCLGRGSAGNAAPLPATGLKRPRVATPRGQRGLCPPPWGCPQYCISADTDIPLITIIHESNETVRHKKYANNVPVQNQQSKTLRGNSY